MWLLGVKISLPNLLPEYYRWLQTDARVARFLQQNSLQRARCHMQQRSRIGSSMNTDFSLETIFLHQFFTSKFLPFLHQFCIPIFCIFAFFTPKFFHLFTNFFLQQNFSIFYTKNFACFCTNFFSPKFFAPIFFHQNFCFFTPTIFLFLHHIFNLRKQFSQKNGAKKTGVKKFGVKK